jgi:hypothetical protein
LALCHYKVVPKLLFENAIYPLDLLLLSKLRPIALISTAASPLTMLTRRIRTPLNGTLLLEAAISFEKQLHLLASA